MYSCVQIFMNETCPVILRILIFLTLSDCCERINFATFVLMMLPSRNFVIEDTFKIDVIIIQIFCQTFYSLVHGIGAIMVSNLGQSMLCTIGKESFREIHDNMY